MYFLMIISYEEDYPTDDQIRQIITTYLPERPFVTGRLGSQIQDPAPIRVGIIHYPVSYRSPRWLSGSYGEGDNISVTGPLLSISLLDATIEAMTAMVVVEVGEALAATTFAFIGESNAPQYGSIEYGKDPHEVGVKAYAMRRNKSTSPDLPLHGDTVTYPELPNVRFIHPVLGPKTRVSDLKAQQGPDFITRHVDAVAEAKGFIRGVRAMQEGATKAGTEGHS